MTRSPRRRRTARPDACPASGSASTSRRADRKLFSDAGQLLAGPKCRGRSAVSRVRRGHEAPSRTCGEAHQLDARQGTAHRCFSPVSSLSAIAPGFECWRALLEEAVHGKLVATKQKNLISTASRIVPKTSTGIWLSTRVFWRTMGGLGTIIRLGRNLRGK
jgi:hypothetical protein